MRKLSRRLSGVQYVSLCRRLPMQTPAFSCWTQDRNAPLSKFANTIRSRRHSPRSSSMVGRRECQQPCAVIIDACAKPTRHALRSRLDAEVDKDLTLIPRAPHRRRPGARNRRSRHHAVRRRDQSVQPEGRRPYRVDEPAGGGRPGFQWRPRSRRGRRKQRVQVRYKPCPIRVLAHAGRAARGGEPDHVQHRGQSR